MAEKILVNQVYEKDDQGVLQGPYNSGASFENIVDTRQGQEGYTLAQFFDNYIKYMQNTTFVYTGENTPKNSHIGIWIDTNSSNADQIGQTTAINE